MNDEHTKNLTNSQAGQDYPGATTLVPHLYLGPFGLKVDSISRYQVLQEAFLVSFCFKTGPNVLLHYLDFLCLSRLFNLQDVLPLMNVPRNANICSNLLQSS